MQLNAGLDKKWIPNATIFEYLIRELCESGNKEEARLVLNSMTVRIALHCTGGALPGGPRAHAARMSQFGIQFLLLPLLRVDSLNAM